jgi:FMN phosphatase YigB (HAD superfamily)/glutathione synthase/RimK-type ligase-like ATP-grasp enzyme
MNVLFLNAGRRCELIKAFKRVLSKFPGGGLVYASDITPTAPALQIVDGKVIFPHSTDSDFKKQFVDFCLEKNIDLVIPTIDPDLLVLDNLRQELEVLLPEVTLLLPNSKLVQISSNKLLTKKEMISIGVKVPLEVDPQQENIEFPLFIKPISGSAAIGTAKVNDEGDLKSCLKSLEEPILEEFISGAEYTVDVFCNKDAKALLAIPRKRLAVRGGEVAKGIIERDVELEKIACFVAESLECDSPITIQFIKRDDEYVLIEINARLGGGLPLSIASGADWPLWILESVCGREPTVADHVSDGVIMSRFDDSVFERFTETAKAKPDLSKVKMLILDMDDTLYPERDFVYNGYREVAKFCLQEYGVCIEGELRRRFDLGERGDLFSTVLKSKGIRIAEYEALKLVKVYRSHQPCIIPYIDVEILKELKEQGYLLTLISDGWQDVQERKWQALGLDDYFEHKIFTDQLGREYWKPHCRSFELICQWMELDFDEAVYIADNPHKDFIAPNKLGMHSLRINRYGSVHGDSFSDLASNDAEYDITSFVELRELLK